MQIITSFGGPCIYKRGILKNGTKTGRVQDIGQSKKKLMAELLQTLETGRDDVRLFCDRIKK